MESVSHLGVCLTWEQLCSRFRVGNKSCVEAPSNVVGGLASLNVFTISG